MAAAMRGGVLGKVGEHLHSETAVEAIGDLSPPWSPHDLRRHATRGSGLGHDVIGQLVGTLYKSFARMNFVDHAVFQGRLGVNRLASQKRIGGPEKGEEPAAAKVRIAAIYDAHDPSPSIIVDSGNGLQALWLLEEPYPFPRPASGLDKDARKAAADVWARPIEDRNKVLAAATGAPAGTANVDRLLRLPGTINYPNKAKVAAGRVPCQARIVKLSDARYPLGLFDEVVPEASKGNGADKASLGGNGADHSARAEASAKIELDWAKVAEHEGWLKSVNDLPADFPFKGKLIVGHHGDLAELNDTLSAAGLINVPYEFVVRSEPGAGCGLQVL